MFSLQRFPEVSRSFEVGKAFLDFAEGVSALRIFDTLNFPGDYILQYVHIFGPRSHSDTTSIIT
jgi:hypothetical protein